MGPFEYFEPRTVEEAMSLLSRYGDKAKLLAGGTDLVVRMKEQAVRPQYVISIGGIADLNYIRFDSEKGVRIGSVTTIRNIERSPELHQRYRVICQSAGQLASMQVRNVATVGGNLCNAAPSADMAPALIALSAGAKLVSAAGARIVPLEEFFSGPYRTAMKSDELLAEVQIPVLPVHTAGVYLKHMIRGAGVLGSVGVAVVLALDSRNGACTDAKVALGAVAPTPMRAREAETILKGERITEELIETAAQTASAETRPRDSIRGSAEYKKELVRIFTRDAIRLAAKQAK